MDLVMLIIQQFPHITRLRIITQQIVIIKTILPLITL